MTVTLVDSSVLLDVIAPSDWREWSEQRLAAAADAGDIAINQVIYAEIAPGYSTKARLERAVNGLGVRRLNLPFGASWRVAAAFAEYRRAGGTRTTALPDFFIGAHAAVAGLPLLTRDARRIRRYFQDVDLIAPDGSR